MDDDIWSSYTKRVKPLKKPPVLETEKKNNDRHARVQPAHPRLNAKKIVDGRDKPGHDAIQKSVLPITFNKRTERNLRQGSVTIDGTLDLHGMYQKEAHEALLRFVEKHIRKGSHILLIVTGKGKQGGGVLRLKLPDWLQVSGFAAQILSLRPAAISHGGTGAFYVILRRGR